MQTVNVNLECDVMFNEEGELEVYIYMGSGDDPSTFKFNFNDILESNVLMYVVSSERPYIRQTDTEAHYAISTLVNTLKEGVEYVNKLKNEYLDNGLSDNDKDTDI